MEFFEASKSDAGPSAPAVPVCWSRPLKSFYKVNFNVVMVAMFENLGCAGIGVAIWD